MWKRIFVKWNQKEPVVYNKQVLIRAIDSITGTTNLLGGSVIPD